MLSAARALLSFALRVLGSGSGPAGAARARGHLAQIAAPLLVIVAPGTAMPRRRRTRHRSPVTTTTSTGSTRRAAGGARSTGRARPRTCSPPAGRSRGAVPEEGRTAAPGGRGRSLARSSTRSCRSGPGPSLAPDWASRTGRSRTPVPRRRPGVPSRPRTTSTGTAPSTADCFTGNSTGNRATTEGEVSADLLPRAAPSRCPPPAIHVTVEVHGPSPGGDASRRWSVAPMPAGAYADPSLHLMQAAPRNAASLAVAPGAAANGGCNLVYLALSDDEARAIRTMRMGSLEPLRMLTAPHGTLTCLPGSSVSMH